MIRRTQAYINLAALQHNFNRVCEIVGKRHILAMIKANAYGHGLLRVAKALSNVTAFGVASVEEAWILHEGGVQHPIVVMSGFRDREELSLLSEKNFTAVIHNFLQMDLLMKKKLPVSIWIKIDTGMHRLGFLPNEIEHVYQRILRLDHIKKPLVVMTHLADANNPNREFTTQQLEIFYRITKNWTGLKSLSNSAAILAYTDQLADFVRPGLMLYGVSPFYGRTGVMEGLKPVMTLAARILAIKQLKKGDYIGYGCAWRCPEDMPIAVISIGYGDGYSRHAKSGTPVLIHGVQCPLVGRVSMDMITVDLRHQPHAKIGDEIILWGKDLPVEKIAECADTIPYELLCNVTQRVTMLEVNVP